MQALNPVCWVCLASLQQDSLCSHVAKLADAVWGVELLRCAHLRWGPALVRPLLLKSRLLARVPRNLRVSPGPGLWLRDINEADLRTHSKQLAD